MRISKALVIFMMIVGVLSIHHLSFAKEREGEVTVVFNLNAPANSKEVRLWVPSPVSDENQIISDVKVSGNFSGSAFIERANMGIWLSMLNGTAL